MSKAASDLQCPVCGQDAEGRRAAKRVKKWAADSRLDRFMFDKLMTLVKAKMYGGEGAVEEERSPKTAKRWAKDKLRDKAGEDLRQQISRELWGDKKPPTPQFREVQPVTLTPDSYAQRAKAQKLRAKALKQRQKLKPEGDGEDADLALDYAEKKNEKLAKDRAYQRKYYHANKERIERLRKARAERRVGTRRSSNTGAKANGH